MDIRDEHENVVFVANPIPIPTFKYLYTCSVIVYLLMYNKSVPIHEMREQNL